MGDGESVFGHAARRQRSEFDFLAKGLTLEEFADEEGCALVRADVVDSENVGVIQRSDGFRFLLEAAQAVGILGERFGKDFDGHGAVEAGVPGAIDFAHAASAQLTKDFVGS